MGLLFIQGTETPQVSKNFLRVCVVGDVTFTVLESHPLVCDV